MVFDGIEEQPALPAAFSQAAETPSPSPGADQVMVTLPIDADLLAYFQRSTEPAGWKDRINGLLRFFVETNLAIEAEWEDAARRTDQPQPPPPEP